MARIILIIIFTIGATVTPALAYQTDVDPQSMHFRRTSKAAWNERQERERRQAARAAAAAEASARVEAVEEPEAVSAGVSGSYPSGVLSAEQVASYARGAGFPEDVIPTMVAIAFRESRFNPAAINPTSGACGLWQLYPCPGPHALNPATNAALAFAKYSNGGLAHWGY